MIRLSPSRLARVLVRCVPAVLLGGLAYVSGGFFPDATGAAAVAVLVLLVLWFTLAPRPLRGLSWPLVVVAILLALYAGWLLLSSSWSHAPGRAVLEYQRALLYLGVLVLCGLTGRSARGSRWMARSLALAGVAVLVPALLVWLVPESFAVAGFTRGRLNWPTSYANATGLIAGLTAIWTLHLASAPREHAIVRSLGAGAVPLAAAAVVLSVSRGAVAATAVGLVVYVVAARSRTLLTAVLAVAPFTIGAVLLADATRGLGVPVPSPVALADARDTLWLLLACAAGAAAVRFVLALADRRMLRVQVAPRARVAGGLVAGAAVLVAAVVGVALGGIDRAGDAVDEFASSAPVTSTEAPGERLGKIGGNGRVDHWRAALDLGYQPEKLHGSGAGTYKLLWERARPTTFSVVDGHSLYVEVLGELGIVGLALLVAVLGGILLALARRSFGPDRHAWAALFAAGVALAVRAGADWDWEMPAVTAWLFGAGGLALAAAPRTRLLGSIGRTTRIVAALACLGLAIVPALVWRSQVRTVDAVQALRGGDCAAASNAALDAIDALSVRPEPFEVLAYCQARLGPAVLARRSIRAAIRRDPGSWELRYGQAIVDGATGRDPRPAAREAVRRNPREPAARGLLGVLEAADRREWRRLTSQAPLPIPQVRR